MLVRITEQDKLYVSGLRKMLLDGGAKVTSDETVLEVSDDFDHEQFHGLQVATSTVPFSVEFAPEIDWLKKYDGNFGFYLSLKSQLAVKGTLSPKQIECVKKAIARENAPLSCQNGEIQPINNSKPSYSAKDPAKMAGYSLKPGDIINVSRWLAKEVGYKAGLTRSHYTLEVAQVDAETDRAYKATLMLSGQRMGRCGICGLALTDPKSVTAGIGPICAEKVGVSFTDGSLEELREQLKTSRTVNTWFPKSAIREKIEKEG